jgi:hypothetical protein
MLSNDTLPLVKRAKHTELFTLFGISNTIEYTQLGYGVINLVPSGNQCMISCGGPIQE